MGSLLAGFLGALALAHQLTPLCAQLAQRLGVVDLPSSRKVHTIPMPMLGGLAAYLAFGAATWLFVRPVVPAQVALLLFGAAGFALIGLLDDLRSAGAWKLLLESVLVIEIVYLGGFKLNLPWPFLGEILAILWIVGAANAFNCLDCMDGVAGGVAAITGLAMACLALLANRLGVAIAAACAAGAALGFLRYNFPPAKIFLGDAGSLMFGFILASLGAAIVVNDVSWTMQLSVILLLGIPVGDFLVVHARRYRAGTRHPLGLLTSTGKDHLPHRLAASGLTPRRTAIWIYEISALVALGAIALAVGGPIAGVPFLLLAATRHAARWRVALATPKPLSSPDAAGPL